MTTSTEKQKPLQVFLDPDLHQAFKIKALMEKTTVSALIREWVERYVTDNGR